MGELKQWWASNEIFHWLPVAMAAAVIMLAVVALRHARHCTARELFRQLSREALETFFDSVLRIPSNRALEGLSVAGLVGMMAGKLVYAVMVSDIETNRAFSAMIGSVAIAAFWQFWAVQWGSLENRRQATFVALVSWILTTVNMVVVYATHSNMLAVRLVFEYIVPFSALFSGVCVVQLFVLTHEILTIAAIPPEKQFAYYVVDNYERLFPLRNSLKLDIVAFIDASHRRWLQVRAGETPDVLSVRDTSDAAAGTGVEKPLRAPELASVLERPATSAYVPHRTMQEGG